ncbi:MAG: type III polyketide synthase [Phycisphaeraceae bacterium]
MTVSILGLGTALPQHQLPQGTAAAMSSGFCCDDDAQTKRFESLYLRSGVQSRHSVLLETGAGNGNGHTDGNGSGSGEGTGKAQDLSQSFFLPRRSDGDMGPGTEERMQRYIAAAAPLAQESSQLALKRAAVAPDAIDHLVTVSCTGFAAPGVDIALIERLGLRRDVSRTHVGFMGCHGVFNGLRVGNAMANQGAGGAGGAGAGHVLVCAVELCSLHFAYGWDVGRVVANALFADGSGAVVLGATGSGGAADSERGWQLAANGSCVVPESNGAMTWNITDNGFAMTLSPQIPALIRQHLKPWLEGWLAKHELTVEQVGSWAVHPGGPRILQSVEAALELPDDALADSRAVLEGYGNMSSPTILFILDRLRNRNAERPCVALGFGPGLAIEAMLLR